MSSGRWSGRVTEVVYRRVLESQVRRVSALSSTVTVVYPPPRSLQLPAETVRELDDKLFSSDPFSYFTSRISSLLSRLDSARVLDDAQPAPGSAAQRFDRLVGQVGPQHRASSAHAIELQVALDALALRHHAAESLLRLAYVLLRRRGEATDAGSVWAAIADSPTQIGQVVEGLQEQLADEATRWDDFVQLVYPSGPGDGPTTEEEDLGVRTFAEWFNFALGLFAQPQHVDATAAHHKVKHGLGVRPAFDDLVLTSTAPDSDGTLPSSVFDDGLNLFDVPTLEFLSRPGSRRQAGLEATQMRMDAVQLIAEAALIAHEYAAMFCVAAHEYFAGRDDVDHAQVIPDYPGLLVGGPLPKHVRPARRPVALRFPLTLKPDGDAPRPSVIVWTDGSVQVIRVGELRRLRVRQEQ